MYCPKCAESNNDDVKFCRSCGENLSVIAQAMTRRFPSAVLNKLDAYFERKYERLRRDSIINAVSGCAFLFISIYHLLKGDGFSGNVIFTFIFACLLFVLSIWDFLAFQRSKSPNLNPSEISSASTAKELSPERPLATVPLLSVTEQTTRHLEAVSKSTEKLNKT